MRRARCVVPGYNIYHFLTASLPFFTISFPSISCGRCGCRERIFADFILKVHVFRNISRFGKRFSDLRHRNNGKVERSLWELAALTLRNQLTYERQYNVGPIFMKSDGLIMTNAKS